MQSSLRSSCPSHLASDISPRIHQDLDNVQVSTAGRGDEGGELVPIHAVDVNSLLQVLLHLTLVSANCGGDESCTLAVHGLDVLGTSKVQLQRRVVVLGGGG